MMDDVLAPEEHDSIEGVPPPSVTEELIGHRAAWAELQAAYESGRLHHAWLLQGPRGVGKATAAFAFARLVLSNGDPVKGAVIRRQIAQESHPNVLYLSRPASDRGGGFKSFITVDEVRRLNRFFQATSGEAWRIAILDPADDMNRSAANALLKILEEPPRRSLILITNHTPGRLLPTIRSRCRTLRFGPLEPTDLGAILKALPLQLAGAEVERAVALAQGSARRAVSFAASGAFEVEERLRGLLGVREPDWGGIQQMVDALTLKGRETAYDLTIELALAKIADAARMALGEGEAYRASRLADFWQSEAERFAAAAAFNLDRKQNLLTFFLGYFALAGELN
ncbi:DNA polymerase III subunit delta' [Consotaella salsifontis]|uniref:DNA polymerase-3 subunit delta n=1 Tax=Consotaella salsifontis TaxID=1365950 RepID=A0A1T4LXB1_9HYPH|nr:DNA polymerase III subunit delta' [Consotaella salsifontis]SJZ59379.1 DNA polymerase-3 subunit delta' [Consotaella salsifontis]